MEGHLIQPDGTSEKVAVKTMKCKCLISKVQITLVCIF